MTRRASIAWFLASAALLAAAATSLQRDIDAENRELRERTVRRLRHWPVIVFGDSQIQCGVDERLDDRLLSLATGSEHYVFTRQKARLFRPRVAVVGVWLHSFLPYYEELIGRVYLNTAGVWDMSMTQEAWHDVLARSDFESASLAVARSVVPFVGTQFTRGIAQKRRGFGGFFDLPGRAAFVGEEVRAWARRADVPPGSLHASPQARDLRALVGDWREQGVPVVLLSTPVEPDVRAALPPAAVAELRQIVGELVDPPAVRYWDDSAMALPSELFRDSNHLNGEGAKVYTRRLIERLEAESLFPRHGRLDRRDRDES